MRDTGRSDELPRRQRNDHASFGSASNRSSSFEGLLDDLVERHGRTNCRGALVALGTERVPEHTERVLPILQLNWHPVGEIPGHERAVGLGSGDHSSGFRVSELDERELGPVQRAREIRSVARSKVMAEGVPRRTQRTGPVTCRAP